jgi:hypothetical protein
MLTLIEESRPAKLIGSPSGHLGCLAGLFNAIQACWGTQFWPEAVTYKGKGCSKTTLNIAEALGYSETTKMEEKISELRQLKQQRAELDEKIKALTVEVKADMKAFLKQGKKQ